MAGRASGGQLSRRDMAVPALLVLVTLATRALWWGDPVADIDEELYSLIGNGLVRGQLPYVDLWDRKPFGLFALYALAHALGGPGPAAYQVMAALFVLLGGWLVYLLARPLTDRVGAAAAGALAIALMPVFTSHSGQSEALFMPLMLLALWLVRDPGHPRAFARACLAMLVAGLALQIKYTVIAQCLFLGLWVLWGEHRRGVPLALLAAHALLYAALGLAATAAVGALYAALGHWDAWVFANFTSFFDRIPAGQGRFAPRLNGKLALFAAMAALGLYAAWRARPLRGGADYRLYGLWFASCLATVYLPSTIYGYYFAALVPGAVLLAVPFLDRRGPLGWLGMVLLLGFAAVMLKLPDRWALTRHERAEAARLAGAIRPHLAPGRCLYVFDGPTALYPMTGSCLPTRFIYPDHLNNALEREALGISQEAEVARILRAAPPVIVTADREFTPQNLAAKGRVDAEVARAYRPLARAPLHGRIVTAWVRGDATGVGD